MTAPALTADEPREPDPADAPTSSLLAICSGPKGATGGPYTLRVVSDDHNRDLVRVTLYWDEFKPQEAGHRLMERGYTPTQEDEAKGEHHGWKEISYQRNTWTRQVHDDEVEFLTAKVTIDAERDWHMTVEGTDIDKVLWNDRDVERGNWPGFTLGIRLVELGYMPNRAAAYGGLYPDLARKLDAMTLQGWQPKSEDVWTIPCTRLPTQD
ncbi:hypothetical protein QFZ75_007976 [Streptomyces sp. V3I8]|uniref:hypothetical protein n=1 Tax=Streptomyces sp. V3I8 TaxID=3042279 RepID=UPI00278A8CD5|nr:hypothetical protein [Streptomyces sp. V3I8]MDQ1041474.1 hypothetical protein [Streptomyces sp. V3I8]